MNTSENTNSTIPTSNPLPPKKAQNKQQFRDQVRKDTDKILTEVKAKAKAQAKDQAKAAKASKPPKQTDADVEAIKAKAASDIQAMKEKAKAAAKAASQAVMAEQAQQSAKATLEAVHLIRSTQALFNQNDDIAILVAMAQGQAQAALAVHELAEVKAASQAASKNLSKANKLIEAVQKTALKNEEQILREAEKAKKALELLAQQKAKLENEIESLKGNSPDYDEKGNRIIQLTIPDHLCQILNKIADNLQFSMAEGQFTVIPAAIKPSQKQQPIIVELTEVGYIQALQDGYSLTDKGLALFGYTWADVQANWESMQ